MPTPRSIICPIKSLSNSKPFTNITISNSHTANMEFLSGKHIYWMHLLRSSLCGPAVVGYHPGISLTASCLYRHMIIQSKFQHLQCRHLVPSIPKRSKLHHVHPSDHTCRSSHRYLRTQHKQLEMLPVISKKVMTKR